MKERLSKFLEKDGFYFILFICVCIVAVAAVMVSKDSLNNIKDQGENEGEDFVIVEEDLEREAMEIAKIEERKEEIQLEEGKEERSDADVDEEAVETLQEEGELAKTDEEMIIVEDEDDYEEVYTEPNLSTEEMILPVNGTIGTAYTENNLIYSQTLDKWMAHKGIDIVAPLNTPVVAALSGTVQEVYEDPLWGMVVVLSHGDNLLTKYASLSEDGLIEEGASVNKGDVIGKVGDTAAIEMMMDPHIHFEVIEDGISINPSMYLPSISY